MCFAWGAAYASLLWIASQGHPHMKMTRAIVIATATMTADGVAGYEGADGGEDEQVDGAVQLGKPGDDYQCNERSLQVDWKRWWGVCNGFTAWWWGWEAQVSWDSHVPTSTTVPEPALQTPQAATVLAWLMPIARLSRR